MASLYSTQFVNHLEKELVLLCAYVMTDANGAVVLTADQDGDVINPKGLSVAQDSVDTGKYTVTLSHPYFKVLDVSATPHIPQGQAQATVVGTVDLTGLTLSTLNGLTLILDDDVAAASTTTFTTPSSIANIVTQIQAQLATDSNTSTAVDILTAPSGAQYLRARSKTFGSTSSMLITGTGRATLGMGDGSTTQHGAKLGNFLCVGFDPRGSAVTDLGTALHALPQVAQTVGLLYVNPDGTEGTLASGGFFLHMLLKNTNLP